VGGDSVRTIEQDLINVKRNRRGQKSKTLTDENYDAGKEDQDRK
jgi:hypothetical protein